MYSKIKTHTYSRIPYSQIIAIDPDVDKNGVAIYRMEIDGFSEITTMSFPMLIEHLRLEGSFIRPNREPTTLVVVEAGYLIDTNWHTKRGGTNRHSARIGRDQGRNNEVARKIVEMARYYKLPTIEARPLRKYGTGENRKATHADVCKRSKSFAKIKGTRSNQEERDAALIAIEYASRKGLEIRLEIEAQTPKAKRIRRTIHSSRGT